jgi:imidazoleglycerol-phosphate dehydratase
MDETLAQVVMDLSGRPYFAYQVELPKKYKLKDFDPGLAEDFFRSVVNHAGMNLHIRLLYGRDVHHMLEAIFKAFGRALDQATGLDPRIKGVLSTKGKI